MSIIEQAREHAREQADKSREQAAQRQVERHAKGEEALRARLVMQKYGPSPDPPYAGAVQTIAPCRYEVDGVEFRYKRDSRGMHDEIALVQTCPLCGSECFNHFSDLKDLGRKLEHVAGGEPPFLHNCREGDVATLAADIHRVAKQRGVSVAGLYDEIGRNL